jgi:hypothetical protein
MNLLKSKSKGSTINFLIGAVIVILIAVSIIGTIANEVVGAQGNANVTSSASSMLGLVVLLFAVGIVVASVSWATGRQ